MGNYKSRRPGFLQGWQINAAELMFRGKTDEEIVYEIWGEFDKETDEGKKRLRNGKCRLRNLRNDEKFQEFYRSLVTEWRVHHAGKALETIAKQMESNQPWLANKAANDVLTYSKELITGADDNTVLIKFEGMPELGTPDDD